MYRDRYLVRKYHRGPKKGGDLPPDWHKGETGIFVTHCATPVQKVNLEEFSELCEMHIVAGDLRRLYTTELAHNPNPVIHENEPIIAGHSSSTFRGYYDNKSPQIAHKVVHSLQEKRDTISPLLNHVPSRSSSIGEDRNKRIAELQKQAEEEINEKNKRAKDDKKPVESVVQERFLETVIEMNPAWVSKNLAFQEWRELTIHMFCHDSERGKILRDCIESILIGRQFLDHLKLKINSKRNRKDISDSDMDCLYQVAII